MLRVAVVGGGLGGLAAANALAARGIEVSVYEQAPALGEVGAGVQLAPNGARQLRRWGLWDAVVRAGAHLGAGSRYHRQDGTPVAPVVTADSSGWGALFGMHRADLVDILAANLPDGTVRTGHRCTGIEQDDDGARLTFAGGPTAEADVVVAADGIHSTLQHHVVPPSEPVFSGSIAYRGLVPHAQVPDWPTDRFLLWMGEGKHVLVFPVRGGEMVNYVGFVPTGEQQRESWSAQGDPDALRAAFAGWDPAVERLLAQVTSCFWWGLYDREPLPRWTAGRLTLLGDAAHPMLPHLGQGVNQAIEDAATLAVLLDGTDPATAPAALRAYERLRRERTSAVQAGARANGLRYDSGYDDLAVRDAELAATAELRRWIYDHDALVPAQAAAAELRH
ncbi:FAD-dependent monooxygenase [Georgenia alba]|uniref:FAD-dependent monooxygenase n=1 Tax=Georgenia alba TaxID=2233858 RepID=A0ABW2QCD6_9MICO